MNILKNPKVKDLIIILICLFASFQLINNVVGPLVEIKTENNELKKQIDELTEKNEMLQNSLNQSENSSEMEENYIRERFHMSKDDELIFVFPDEE